MGTEVIQRFDGYLAQSQGERLLVYFGYPRAHEDDARRAVLTGLGMVEGMVALNRRLTATAASAGGASGDSYGRGAGGRMGRPSAYHSRWGIPHHCRPAAAPGHSGHGGDQPATLRLVEGYFDCEALGTHLLEDPTEPLTVYRVLQESTAHSRLDVAITRGLTPFVGREHEVGLLHECWAQAKEGRGQVVVLSGEAGIGKSRLVQVFEEHMTGEMHTRLEYHCSPYYQNTALYPLQQFSF